MSGRLAVLAVGLGAAAVALGARAAAVLPAATSAGADVADWVELAVVGGAAAAAAWAALGAALGMVVVTAARTGVRWRAGEAAVRRLAPGVVRRLVRAGLGAGVGAGLALGPVAAFAAEPASPAGAVVAVAADAITSPASAEVAVAADAITSPASAGTPQGAPPRAAGSLVDLAWRPTAPAPPSRTDADVVVVRGDTLWGIAERWLGGEPTDAQILAATTGWHETNRDVIGADPDRILPGQVLRPPA